jgi:transglutaminase/protease-like cytokinesis protein 3
MKKLILIFVLFSSSLFAQNFSSVDKLVSSYPRYRTVEQLAERISKDFSTDIDKVRASFKWITNNIRYNLQEAMQPQKTVIQFRYSSEEERLKKIQEIKDNIVKEAFFTKLGVCEEYAQSLKKLCDIFGIEAVVLSGYVRNTAYEINRVPNTTNHAWNAVKVGDRWMIIDTTWASGFVMNGRWQKKFNDYYFDVDHQKITYTHHTDNRKWNLILNQPSLTAFYKQPIYGKEFLRNNLEVVAPTSGVIEVAAGASFTIQIKNLHSDSQVHYGFMGDEYSKKPTIARTKGVTSLTIIAPTQNTELYLFIDKELALEYKIVVR